MIIGAFFCFAQPLFCLPWEGSTEEAGFLDELAAKARSEGLKTAMFSIGKKDEYHSFSRVVRIFSDPDHTARTVIVLPVSMPEGITTDQYDPGILRSLLDALLPALQKLPRDTGAEIFLTGAHSGLQAGPGLRWLRESGLVDEHARVLEFGALAPGMTWKPDFSFARSHVSAGGFRSFMQVASDCNAPVEYSTLDALQAALAGGVGSEGAAVREGPEWVTLVPGEFPASGTVDAADILVAFLEKQEFLIDDDFRYLPLGWGTGYWVLDETGLATLLFVSMALVLLLLFRRRIRRAYLVSLVRGFPVLLLVTLAWFSFLLLAQRGLEWAAGLGNGRIPLHISVALAFAVALCGAWIMHVWGRRIFSARGILFSAGSLLALNVAIFSSAWADMRLVFPVLAASVPLLVSVLSGRRGPKTFSWALSLPLLPGILMLPRVMEPESAVAWWFTPTGPGPGWFLFLFTLPWILQGFRILRLYRTSRKNAFRASIIALGLVLAIGGFLFVPGVTGTPKESGDAVPVTWITPDKLGAEGIRWDMDTHDFLGRRMVRIQLDGGRDLLSEVRLELRSGEPIVLFQSNFPAIQENRYAIHVEPGVRPPLPFLLTLVLPASLDVRMDLVLSMAGPLGTTDRIMHCSWQMDGVPSP